MSGLLERGRDVSADCPGWGLKFHQGSPPLPKQGVPPPLVLVLCLSLPSWHSNMENWFGGSPPSSSPQRRGRGGGDGRWGTTTPHQRDAPAKTHAPPCPEPHF